MTIAKLQEELISGVVSAKEITADILSKIHADRHNCFITVRDDAIKDAELADKAIKNGSKGRLLGVPVAIKDNMRLKGSVTTCGSAVLHGVDEFDSEVVKRLKAEGAVIIGKTNMDEFAMGSSNTTSHFGRVINPFDSSRVPGGSSGGSAAAVRLGLCFGALGSDTGGSIRQPASYCGVVGLKPTFGSISCEGTYPLSQDMDGIGPITTTVDDNRLLFEVLSGRKTEIGPVRGKKIGLIKEQLAVLTPDTARVIEAAKRVLSANGCTFIELSVPPTSVAYAVYCVLGNAQAAKNLLSICEADERTRLGKEAKKRIVIGEYVLRHPELINRAKAAKRAIIDGLSDALKLCDCIISPTAPSVAFKFTDDTSLEQIVYSDVFTQPPSIAGLPALSVPCVRGENGLPIGLQLVGSKHSEGLLFSLGKLFE